MGIVREGEEAGEISMMVLTGEVKADMLFLGRTVGMQELSTVGGAMMGRGWIFKRMEAALIMGWDSETFWTSSSTFMLSLLTHKSCAGE